MPRAKNEYVIQLFDEDGENSSKQWIDTHWTNAYLVDMLNSENVSLKTNSDIVLVTKAVAKKALAYARSLFADYCFMIVKIPVDKKAKM